MKVITTGLLNRFWTKGIKPWLDKRIKSYADLMVTTASGYTPDALAVKEGFTELNSKLENAKVLIDTITTDESGNAYLGNYVAVFGVSTNTNDTKIEVFKNTLGMFYAHVNHATGANYPGTFQFYIWGIKI